MHAMLSKAQVEQFQQQGYLVLPGMVSQSRCAGMLDVISRHLRDAVAPIEYEAEVGYPGAPESLDAPGGKTARRLRNAWQRDPCFEQWAREPALVSMLAQLLGEDICLTLAHHNCVMTKHPHFGSATGWHRDIRYWSFTRPDLISVWLALGPEDARNGALQIIPGSHRIPIQGEQLDPLDFLRPDLPENQELMRQGRSLELQQGDVLLFHSGLFHAAGRNESDAVKASLVFAYRGKSNLPLPGSKSAAAGDVSLSTSRT
jgi:phytanoyl-CoA hydroxylase